MTILKKIKKSHLYSAVLAGAVIQFAFVVDALWLGVLGDGALEGATLFLSAFWLFECGLPLLENKTFIKMGELSGAGKNKSAYKLLLSMILPNLAWGIVLSTLGAYYIPSLISVFNPEEKFFLNSISFAKWGPYLLVLMPLHMLMSGAHRAFNQPHVALYISFFIAVINIVLDPILIFGAGLGVEGAPLATLISFAFGIVLHLYYLNITPAKLNLPSWKYLISSLKLGSAASIFFLLFNISSYLFVAVSGKHIDGSWGASIVMRAIFFVSVFSRGSTIGISTMINRNKGVHNPLFFSWPKTLLKKHVIVALVWIAVVLFLSCFFRDIGKENLQIIILGSLLMVTTLTTLAFQLQLILCGYGIFSTVAVIVELFLFEYPCLLFTHYYDFPLTFLILGLSIIKAGAFILMYLRFKNQVNRC